MLELHSSEVIPSISCFRRLLTLGSSRISTPGPTGLELRPLGNTYPSGQLIGDT